VVARDSYFPPVCSEMIVTLKDCQKLLVSAFVVVQWPVKQHLVIEGRGWRPSLGECFLMTYKVATIQEYHSPGLSSLLRCVHLEQTSRLLATIVVLGSSTFFGSILFPDTMDDNASWMFLPCLTDWDTTGGYSWASGVFPFLYRQLYEACRRSSRSVSLGG
jgi:hypothetical protein